MMNELAHNNGEIIIYQSDDGKIRLDVRLEDKTVWLTQEQIGMLFNKGRSTITEHINNIFKEGELEKEKVCRNFRHTTQHGAIEGKTQIKDEHYDYCHTQSFQSMVNDMAEYCHRKGGALV